MKTIRNFGYGNAGSTVKKSTFTAFSQQSYSGLKYYNFFSGGISATNSLNFPNSDDQILSIEEIGFIGSNVLNVDDFLQIIKNDKVILKIPTWDFAEKNVSASIATFLVKDFHLGFKRLKNPIIVNGTDSFKIQGYLGTNSSNYTIYLRGKKFSKTVPFIYNEANGKNIARNGNRTVFIISIWDSART